MPQQKYLELIAKHPLISNQISAHALAVILRELAVALSATTSGDVVEFGCYSGTTTLFLRRILDDFSQSQNGTSPRSLHAYDSFAGLPDKTTQDNSSAGDQFAAGELQISKKQFLKAFTQAGLAQPIIHKGWFNELTPSDLPDKIAFAFLDGDFYDSILTSLRLVWPRLVAGSSIIIDDYQRAALPGVERAVNQFFAGKNVHIVLEQQLALMTKLHGGMA